MTDLGASGVAPIGSRRRPFHSSLDLRIKTRMLCLLRYASQSAVDGHAENTSHPSQKLSPNMALGALVHPLALGAFHVSRVRVRNFHASLLKP
jgi:hypothetical protein